jgi:hypothetical protein
VLGTRKHLASHIRAGVEERRITRLRASRMSGRKAEAIEGKSPVCESNEFSGRNPEYHGARGTLWEAGRTTSQG